MLDAHEDGPEFKKNGKTSSVDFLQNPFDRKMFANFRAETGTKADGPR